MPSLSIDQLQDLVTTTQKDLGRMKWTDLGTDIQEFIVLPKLLRRDKIMFKSGEGCQFNFMKEYSDAAKNVGLFEVDDVNVGDVMAVGDVPHRHTTTNYAIDLREKAVNQGAEQIVDLVKTRRAASMGSLAVKLEQDFWSKPASSSDKLTPFGLKYWMVSNNSVGFNGGNPTGFSDGAGNIDSTTITRWKNYTGQYSAVSKADLVKKMRTAYRKTNFRSPTSNPSYARSLAQTFQLYVNNDTIEAFEDVGEAQNENLGRDIASMDGTIVFRGNPFVYVPFLDDDSTDPVYGVNWNVFRIFFLRGWYMRETNQKAAKQHTVLESHVDLSWNSICYDRRRLFLFTL